MKESFLRESEVIEKFEQRVATFIVENIDKEHFDDNDFDLSENFLYDFEDYDKDIINRKLKKIKKKDKEKYAAILLAGKELYEVLKFLEIKTNSNCYYFLAFIRDLKMGVKTIKKPHKYNY